MGTVACTASDQMRRQICISQINLLAPRMQATFAITKAFNPSLVIGPFHILQFQNSLVARLLAAWPCCHTRVDPAVLPQLFSTCGRSTNCFRTTACNFLTLQSGIVARGVD